MTVLTAAEAGRLANNAMTEKCEHILHRIRSLANHGKRSMSMALSDEEAGYLQSLGYNVYRFDVTDTDLQVEWLKP